MKTIAEFVVLLSSFLLISFGIAAQSASTCELNWCYSTSEPTVRFPFRLKDWQPEECGYPGFDLHCNDRGQTIINLPKSGEFVVTAIDYRRRYLYLDNPGGCLPNQFNPSGSPFSVITMSRFVYFNCSGSWTEYPEFYILRLCLKGENDTVVPVKSYSSAAEKVPPGCRRMGEVSIPSLAGDGFDFGVGWTKPAWQTCNIPGVGWVCGSRDDSGREIGCSGNHNSKILIIIIPVTAGFVCIFICVFIVWCWMAKKRGDRVMKRRIHQKTSEANPTLSTDSTAIVLREVKDKVNIEELPLFTFETLTNATNNFHNNNMLGKGGFGPVYLGKLENGREIAIKRLSEASAQGVKEFMNEVIVISKLQHRNLVGLIGCCVEREEKMLIYEYMPNRSLDVSLFGEFKNVQSSCKVFL